MRACVTLRGGVSRARLTSSTRGDAGLAGAWQCTGSQGRERARREQESRSRVRRWRKQQPLMAPGGWLACVAREGITWSGHPNSCHDERCTGLGC
jgi:hypothetical protein